MRRTRGSVTLRDPPQPGQRALAGRVTGTVEQTARSVCQDECLLRSAVGQSARRVRHQAAEDPGVHGIVVEGQSVAAVGTRQSIGAELRAQPRDEHLQRLRRDSGRIVSPHLVDEPMVGDARGVQASEARRSAGRDPATGDPAYDTWSRSRSRMVTPPA